MGLADVTIPITLKSAKKEFGDEFLTNLERELSIIYPTKNEVMFYLLDRIEIGLESKYNIKPIRDDLQKSFAKDKKDEFLLRCIPIKINNCIKLLGLNETYKLINNKYNEVLKEIKDIYINKINSKNFLYIPVLVIEQLLDTTMNDTINLYKTYFE